MINQRVSHRPLWQEYGYQAPSVTTVINLWLGSTHWGWFDFLICQKQRHLVQGQRRGMSMPLLVIFAGIAILQRRWLERFETLD